MINTPRSVTADEIAAYRREGYLKIDLREILGSDVVTRMIDTFIAADEGGYPHSDTGWNKNSEIQFVRHHELHLHYPALAEVALSPLLGKMGANLIGARHMRYYQDETLIKYPGMPVTIWHQDLPFVPMDRRGFMTIWIAMDPITEEMGAVRYLPRSHRLGPIGRVIDYDSTKVDAIAPETLRRNRDANVLENLLREDEFAPVGEPISIPLNPGEAVIHDGLLLHGAFPNTSDKPRRGYGVVLFPENAQYTGAPGKGIDGLGIPQFGTFDHPRFPVIF